MQNERNHGEYEKNMNQPTCHMKNNPATNPGNYQNQERYHEDTHRTSRADRNSTARPLAVEWRLGEMPSPFSGVGPPICSIQFLIPPTNNYKPARGLLSVILSIVQGDFVEMPPRCSAGVSGNDATNLSIEALHITEHFAFSASPIVATLPKATRRTIGYEQNASRIPRPRPS